MDHQSYPLDNCKPVSILLDYSRHEDHKLHRMYFYKCHSNMLDVQPGNHYHRNILDDIPYKDCQYIPVKSIEKCILPFFRDYAISIRVPLDIRKQLDDFELDYTVLLDHTANMPAYI